MDIIIVISFDIQGQAVISLTDAAFMWTTCLLYPSARKLLDLPLKQHNIFHSCRTTLIVIGKRWCSLSFNFIEIIIP